MVNFKGTNGVPPYSSLIQGTDGNLYGTTSEGGDNDCSAGPVFACGTIFKITPWGRLTTLYAFCPQANYSCPDGFSPMGLIQGTDGNFYGTTQYGGANNGNYECFDYPGCGTVFKITPGGKLTTLYTFCSLTNCADGIYPGGPLVQVAGGDFYGTTGGTVFKITAEGKLTTLYTFCSLTNCADGSCASAPVTQGTDGNFYGTTQNGGADNGNNVCSDYLGCGTVFKITPAGEFATLHNFGGRNGMWPVSGLVQATDGDFYGTTLIGGANCPNHRRFPGCGTIFKITPVGKLTTLYNFCSQDYPYCTDGAFPTAALVQATRGTFYGTTSWGGSRQDNCNVPDGVGSTTTCGTIFRLSVGLAPFVETNPTSGKVGAPLTILGNNLKGATSVSFNGTAAAFEASSTSITTNVPAGAAPGTLTVTTPSSGPLSSNVPFRVIPQTESFFPKSGPEGTVVLIEGVSLTQTTQITFGGVAAKKFTAYSDSEVTATVPTGATTGRITITTKGGTATTAAPFTVTE